MEAIEFKVIADGIRPFVFETFDSGLAVAKFLEEFELETGEIFHVQWESGKEVEVEETEEEKARAAEQATKDPMGAMIYGRSKTRYEMITETYEWNGTLAKLLERTIK